MQYDKTVLEESVKRIRRDPPPPGEVVREWCFGLDGSMSIEEGAEQLGVSRGVLDRLLDGRSRISPEMALRMEAAGWATADLWLQVQLHYDLAQERLRQEHAA